MADGGGPARRRAHELTQISREMRRIFPDRDTRSSAAHQELRRKNREQFEKSLRARQRPTRVS